MSQPAGVAGRASDIQVRLIGVAARGRRGDNRVELSEDKVEPTTRFATISSEKFAPVMVANNRVVNYMMHLLNNDPSRRSARGLRVQRRLGAEPFSPPRRHRRQRRPERG